MIAAPPTNELTSRHARAARTIVTKTNLAPAGFIPGLAGAFWRKDAEQIHLIDFQPSKYGGEYTVNLGFHYAFIPGCFSRQFYSVKAFGHLLDCGVRARIGSFLPNARDTWFKYGDDREALVETLSRNVTDCLTIFDKWSRTWKNPEWWTNNLNADGEFAHELIVPWDAPFESIWIASIARHNGLTELVSKQWKKIERQLKKNEGQHPAFYERMWKEVILRIPTP